jgi:hypothetical protein
MDSAKADLADKLKTANNILVTVSRDPSVDQLAACIGLTLLLNKMGKHAAAIFSGQVPSTIEFLEPEETLEKNTDSLRDFIIALDKSKADKLRYKVEDNVVRIFITPYRTSINQDDLEFSQGDFNVDVVVALGVHQQEDLDNAITVHGRILHDAVVASVNLTNDGGLGSISWHDPQASSLSELVTDLAQAVGDDLLDSQIATALLTGIVAATDRFSNDKTSSQTMNVSAKLMAAGANQQLVASKLENAPPERPSANGQTNSSDTAVAASASAGQGDGTLEIEHEAPEEPPVQQQQPIPEDHEATGEIPQLPNDHFAPLSQARGTGPQAIFELPTPQLKPADSLAFTAPEPDHAASSGGLMTEAPTLGGVLTANTQPEDFDPVTDPMSFAGNTGQLLDHGASNPSAYPASEPSFAPPPPVVPSPPPETTTPPSTPAPVPDPYVPSFSPPPPPPSAPADVRQDGQTLADLEYSVHSPHVDTQGLDTARDEVSRALVDDSVMHPEPIQSLGAQPLGAPLHADQPSVPTEQPAPGPSYDNPGNVIAPTPRPTSPSMSAMSTAPQADPDMPSGSPPPSMSMPSSPDPNAPPVVPPPIPFQFGVPQGPPATGGPMMPL